MALSLIHISEHKRQNMAYGIKEQECRLDLSKKHTGKCYQHLPI